MATERLPKPNAAPVVAETAPVVREGEEERMEERKGRRKGMEEGKGSKVWKKGKGGGENEREGEEERVDEGEMRKNRKKKEDKLRTKLVRKWKREDNRRGEDKNRTEDIRAQAAIQASCRIGEGVSRDLTCKAELPARHTCCGNVPPTAAHGAPVAIPVRLHSAFPGCAAIGQPQRYGKSTVFGCSEIR